MKAEAWIGLAQVGRRQYSHKQQWLLLLALVQPTALISVLRPEGTRLDFLVQSYTHYYVQSAIC
jgi:hypothetical protein